MHATLRSPAPASSDSAGASQEQAAAGTLRDPVLWCVLALQTALALPGFSTRSLWLDEAYSAVLARRSFADICTALRHDSGPPLYYFLLHLWRAGFGESPAALRAPSLLFALGSTLFLYRLVSTLFDRATARTATALWALTPLAAFYAGEVRSYTLLAFLALALLTFLLEPGLRRAARIGGVGLTVLALVYTHNAGWFVVAAAFGATIALKPRQALDPAVIGAAATAALAFLPWLPVARAQVENIDWVRWLWSPWAPLQSLATFPPFGWAPVHIDIRPTSVPWWIAATALWTLPAAAAVVLAIRRRDAIAGSFTGFLVLGLGLPALASTLVRPMSLPGRHDFFLLPVMALLVALGLRAFRTPLRTAALAALLALGIAATVRYHRRASPLDEHAWADAVAARARPGDVVLCTGFTRPPAEYLLAGRGLAFLSYPRQMAKDLAHLDEQRYLTSVDLAADGRAVVAEARTRLPPRGTLWLLASSRAVNQPLFEALAAERDLQQEEPLRSAAMGLRRLGEPIAVVPFVARVSP